MSRMPSPYGQRPGFDPLSEEELAKEKGTTGYDLPGSEEEETHGRGEKRDYLGRPGRYSQETIESAALEKEPQWQREERGHGARKWILVMALVILVILAGVLFWAVRMKVDENNVADASSSQAAAIDYDWTSIMSQLASINSQYPSLGYSSAAPSSTASAMVSSFSSMSSASASASFGSFMPSSTLSSSASASASASSSASSASAQATALASLTSVNLAALAQALKNAGIDLSTLTV